MNDILNFLIKNKIKKYSKILNLELNQNIDNDFLEQKKIKIKNSKNIDDENELYDVIICYDFFLEDKDTIKLEKVKKKLKENGKIIFINELITTYFQYKYHPFSYLRHIFDNPFYITYFFENINNNNLRVLDVDRIYSLNLWTYPIQYFSIICEIKI